MRRVSVLFILVTLRVVTTWLQILWYRESGWGLMTSVLPGSQKILSDLLYLRSGLGPTFRTRFKPRKTRRLLVMRRIGPRRTLVGLTILRKFLIPRRLILFVRLPIRGLMRLRVITSWRPRGEKLIKVALPFTFRVIPPLTLIRFHVIKTWWRRGPFRKRTKRGPTPRLRVRVICRLKFQTGRRVSWRPSVPSRSSFNPST